MIRLACPRCKAVLQQPDTLAGTTFACPSCGQQLQMPAPAEDGAPAPPAATVPPPPPPALERKPAQPPPLPSAPPRQRARRYEEDDDDDFPSIERRGSYRSRYSAETSARAAALGLTFSLLALGLLVVAFVLWLLAAHASQNPQLGGGNTGPFLLITLVIEIAAFVLALLAIIYSNRGLDVSNQYNRGQATAGLVCGILALVLSCLSGLFYICTGVFLLAAH